MQNHLKIQSKTPRAKILLVVDDLEAARVWVLSLNQAGFDVVLAVNSSSVMRVWAKELPDLVVLADFDEQLEEIELCRALRKVTEDPLILLSSKNSETFQLEAYRAGADEVISFPVTPRLFQAKVNALLRRGFNRPQPGPDQTHSYSTGVPAPDSVSPTARALQPAPEKPQPLPEKPKPTPEKASSSSIPQVEVEKKQPVSEKLPQTSILQSKQEKLQTLRNKINVTGMLPTEPDAGQLPSLMYEMGKKQRELEKSQAERENSKPVPEETAPAEEAELPGLEENPPAQEEVFLPPQQIHPTPEENLPAAEAIASEWVPEPEINWNYSGPYTTPQADRTPSSNVSEPEAAAPEDVAASEAAALEETAEIAEPAAAAHPAREPLVAPAIPLTAPDPIRSAIFPQNVLEEIYPTGKKAQSRPKQASAVAAKGKRGPFHAAQTRLQKRFHLNQKQWYLLGVFVLVEALMVVVILGMLLSGYARGSGTARVTPGAQDAPASAPLAIGANATPLPTPTVPRCDPRLLFDAAQYAIQPLALSADGSIPTTGEPAGVAYQYLGGGVKYVFGLSPTPANLGFGQSLQAGALVTILEADCSMVSYTLGAPEAGAVYQPAAAEQSTDGIILFIANAPEGQGFVVRGGLLAPEVIVTSTPDAAGPGIEAEIGLLETMSFAANTKISVRISLYNYGTAPFTLNPADVLVEQPGAEAIALEGSDPGLPLKINPGETREIVLTFPRPAADTALIRILNVEYDLQGY